MSDEELIALLKRIAEGFKKATKAMANLSESYRTFNETLAKYQG